MLAPEVWSIETKETSKNKHKSEFKQYKIDDINDLINSHHFNHSVAFTFAGETEIPAELSKILETDNEYYLLNDIKVSEFYNSTFVDLFMKKGKLTVLSIENNIHSSNSFAITPSGHLVLRLLEDSYFKFGIEGKRTDIWSNPHYVITLDLNRKEIMAGKLYKRYQKFITDSNLRFDVLLIWEPYDSSICPSSIASYFYKKSCKVSLCSPKHTFYEQHEKTVMDPFQTEPEDFLHWYGVHLIDTNKQIEAKESSKKCNIMTHKWTGFFSSNQVLNLWKHLRRENTSESNKLWFSLYFSGFHNSPVNLISNRSDETGDHFFTIFCTNERCVVYPPKPIKKIK